MPLYSTLRAGPGLIAAIVCASLGIAARGQSIIDLGLPPGGANASAGLVTADGSVVAGHVEVDGRARAFRWTMAGGMQTLGVLPMYDYSYSTGMSRDGSVIVGYCQRETSGRAAWRWTAAEGMVPLPLPPGTSDSAAYGCDGDGSVIVGLIAAAGVPARPVRWAPGGIEVIELPSGSVSGLARSISADGLVVVGSFDRSGFRWTSEDGVLDLGYLPGGDFLNTAAVSGDGRVIVGAGSTTEGQRAFRWTREDGPRSLGAAPGWTSTSARAVNVDGSVIIGRATGGKHWVWTAALGMVSFEMFAAERGLDLSGWVVDSINGLSEDGRLVVGSGDVDGSRRAFLVRMPCVDGPAVTRQPQGGVACIGERAELSVTAAGPGAMAFAWQRDGVAIDPVDPRFSVTVSPDGLMSTLIVHELRGEDAGTAFGCRVSNPCGWADSESVAFEVCIADATCDGVVQVSDYAEFLSRMASADGRADLNGDGEIDFIDLLAFLNAYSSGC